MNTDKTIYIAGPMRGIEYYNFPAFDDARDRLQIEGWRVVSPADIDREEGFDPYCWPACSDWSTLDKIAKHWKKIIKRDLKAVLDCDAIYMLNGWEDSTGAKAELAVAQWADKEVLYEGRSDAKNKSFTQARANEALRDFVDRNKKKVGGFIDWEEEDKELSKRLSEDVLEEALRITGGDRQNSYGPPDQDFRRTAIMWEQILNSRIENGKLSLQPEDVAMCMIALKLSRQTHQQKRDNWVDIAGYARCGSLCSENVYQKADQQKADNPEIKAGDIIKWA